MRLFIAPKRDVALSISVALGGPAVPEGASFKLDEDEVTWLSGHLLRLGNPQEYNERYESWSLDDLPMTWPISYLPDDRHQHQLSAVIELARQADELVNAGDPDPEGQRLIDEVIEYAGLDAKPTARLLINDNNPVAILKASLSMRNNQNFRGLSLSALARSVCDQHYGFNLTRTYTLLARRQGYIGVLSVGRVQTPILGLIVSRDKAHQSHAPITYYEVAADIQIKNQVVRCKYVPPSNKADELEEGKQIDFVSESQRITGVSSAITEQSMARKIAAAIKNQPINLDSASTQEINIPPPLPHSLLSLQAEAAGLYGFKPSYVHEIAQRLRDDFMAITYHRSDSRYLNNEHFREASVLLESLSLHYPDITAACDKNQRSQAFDSGKATAHHAIIPTSTVVPPDALNDDERRIYTLIVRAYAVQFYQHEIKRETTLVFDIAGYRFEAIGHVNKSKGWRALLGDDYDLNGSDDVLGDGLNSQAGLQDLESITRFDHGKLAGITLLNHHTSAPTRYTMKTLLQDLTKVAQYVTDPAIKKLLIEKDSAKQDEAGGIGTPATRDKHIETLFTRGFITEVGGYVVSTGIGRDFHDALPDFAVKPDMTALWHEKQKQIESGVLDYQAFIGEVDTIIANEISRAKRVGLNINVKPIVCPTCDRGHLVLRTSKANHQFWGCSAFPACRTTFNDKKGRPDLEQT